MACLNNDKSIMSRPYAWRVLGILPILKASACTNTDQDWQRQHRLDMYHRAMDPVIAEINELCKTARFYRWADKLVRLGCAFWHIISIDGLEIAATALSNTMECPTCQPECKCPKDELERTDKLYPVRSSAQVGAGVEKARAELLNRDGSIKDLPRFIRGNRHPTIPHRFKDDRRLGDASADTQRDRGNGSRLYEVNIWMWRYGRGRSRMVSIAEGERMRSESLSESRLRAAETRKRRSEVAAAAGAAEGGGGAD